MKILTTIVFLLLINTFLKSEELPTLSIFELVCQSKAILIVEPMNSANDITSLFGASAPNINNFKIVSVIKSEIDLPKDTIQIVGLENYKWEYSPEEYGPNLIQIKKILLFIYSYNRNFYPVTSGIRLLSNNNIFFPFQIDTNSPYNFSSIAESNKWHFLLQKIDSNIIRLKSVLSLREISPAKTRNDSIFNWIKIHEQELNNHYGIDDFSQKDITWGNFRWEVFQWIIAGGIWQDAWRAMKLYQKLNDGDGISHSNIRNVIPPFASEESRMFLLNIALDSTVSMNERELALFQLWHKDNLWVKDETRNNYPQLSSISTKEQSILNDAMIRFLKIEPLRSTALGIIEATNQYEFLRFENESFLNILKYMISAYKSEKPSYFKMKLAEYLVNVLDAEQWFEISGNKKGILIYLETAHYSKSENRISFQWTYINGKEPVKQKPTLVLERIGEVDNILEKIEIPLPVYYPEINWDKYDSTHFENRVTVEFKTEKLSAGKWRVGTKGVAGEQNEYKWTSESWIFDIEN